MNIFLLILVIFFLGAVSFFLTWLIIRNSVKRNLMSVPNARSLHDRPTPKGGGIAIVFTWYTGITIFYLCGIIEKSLFLGLLCGILLAIVSFIDDLIGLKPVIRLVFQFITAIAAFYIIGGLRPLIIPQIQFNYNYFVYPLAIIGMVWFINLFNFMDGADGFASVEVITVCSVLFIFSWGFVNILLIVCMAGFLYWNWPKARIFMGDVGSTQLGFILVLLGIYYHNAYDFSILNWVMLTSPFWFDATLTLFRRCRNGERLSEAHYKHVYQRFVRSGFSHEQLNIALILINLVIILFIVLYRMEKVLQIPLFILTLFVYYFLTKQVDKRTPFNS